MKSTFESDGFFVQPNVVSDSEIESLMACCSSQSEAGIRDLFSIREVQSLACSPAIRYLMESVLGRNCFAVRAILFDKSPDANWKVAWHQDLTIAVKTQAEVTGYGPWSIKDGIVHVQPPDVILEQMLSIRVHLDDCNLENAPLRVIPGTHMHGRLSPEQIEFLRSKTPEKICTVPKGGVLLMRPLILHASSKAISPSHRRVIHLDFSSTGLAPGLDWYEKIS
jgi:ectoine hydroxylase-related dioxygenase (phytanoyl-CoA dioxygenase family)